MEKRIKICMVTTISGTFDAFISDSARNFAEKRLRSFFICGAFAVLCGCQRVFSVWTLYFLGDNLSA